MRSKDSCPFWSGKDLYSTSSLFVKCQKSKSLLDLCRSLPLYVICIVRCLIFNFFFWKPEKTKFYIKKALVDVFALLDLLDSWEVNKSYKSLLLKIPSAQSVSFGQVFVFLFIWFRSPESPVYGLENTLFDCAHCGGGVRTVALGLWIGCPQTRDLKRATTWSHAWSYKRT